MIIYKDLKGNVKFLPDQFVTTKVVRERLFNMKRGRVMKIGGGRLSVFIYP